MGWVCGMGLYRSPIVQPHDLTSVTISEDSKFAIVNHQSNVSFLF
jgi:hypothetical protein